MDLAKLLPEYVAHADWSVNPKKRWLASAELKHDLYHLEPAKLYKDARGFQNPSRLVLGVDFPLGLPSAYAEAVNVSSFRQFVASIRRGEQDAFFDVADSAEIISLQRPFYPKRPGGTKMQQLLDGLGFENKLDLYRWCDRATDERRAGASMFWTMGANQIGKGMLAGWRELILPNWGSIALWPFDGMLPELLKQDKMILVEAYPGEFYRHLGMFAQRGSKRKQADRQREGAKLLNWGEANRVVISAELRTQIVDGFGPKPDGEDPFDAVVGLFGMLNVILGNRDEMPLLPKAIRDVEGWVFGQTAYPIVRS